MLFVGSIKPSDTKQLLLPHCYLPVNCLRFDVGCSRHWPLSCFCLSIGLTIVFGNGPQGDVVENGESCLFKQQIRHLITWNKHWWFQAYNRRCRGGRHAAPPGQGASGFHVTGATSSQAGFFGRARSNFWKCITVIVHFEYFWFINELRWSRYTLGSTVISILLT